MCVTKKDCGSPLGFGALGKSEQGQPCFCEAGAVVGPVHLAGGERRGERKRNINFASKTEMYS